jgi:hypothetical protein
LVVKVKALTDGGGDALRANGRGVKTRECTRTDAYPHHLTPSVKAQSKDFIVEEVWTLWFYK